MINIMKMNIKNMNKFNAAISDVTVIIVITTYHDHYQ